MVDLFALLNILLRVFFSFCTIRPVRLPLHTRNSWLTG